MCVCVQVVCLEFGWRAAFKSLVPQMAHCVKVVLDDVCNKNLQQEEATHALGSANILITPVTHSHGPERDSPRMVAKVTSVVYVLNEQSYFLIFKNVIFAE